MEVVLQTLQSAPTCIAQGLLIRALLTNAPESRIRGLPILFRLQPLDKVQRVQRDRMALVKPSAQVCAIYGCPVQFD